MSPADRRVLVPRRFRPTFVRSSIAAGFAIAAFGAGTTAGTAASPPSFSVTTVTPATGQTVSGSITWQVSVSGDSATRVDFAIDGAVKWSQQAAPYLYGGKSAGLDTTQLSNGSHTLNATAYRSRGKLATTQVSVTVANAPPPPPPPPPAGRAYWGAWIGSQLTGAAPPWDMSAVMKFEQMVGKPLSLLNFGSPFANCSTTPCTYYSFPWTPFNDIRAHGAIPFLSWSSQSLPSSLNQPDYQLSDVTAGAHDAYIRTFAQKARDWGHPFFLRFDWEMNGDWFSWAEGVNGNQPGDYVAAWRHVHDIFTSVGANNVSWVWCPYVDPNSRLKDVGPLYPGDAYVDWTCLDGFNWGTNPNSAVQAWRSFYALFNPTYHAITDTVAPSKPMLVGETASSEYGGSKQGWIHNMFAWLKTDFPKIRGLSWFEAVDNAMDWPIETSSTAQSAFATGIQDPRFVPNELGSLSASPIPAP